MGDLAKALHVSLAEARRVATGLELQGYIKHQGSEWMTTVAGEKVSGAKPPRFTREVVDKALDELRDHIRQVNADPKCP